MTSAADVPLLAELGRLLDRLDPVPPESLDEARQLFCWRSLDAELAELSFDSLLERDLAVAVRSGDSVLEPRMLGFGAVVDGEDLSIEIEVSATDGQCTMVGQLDPPGATSIGIEARDGEVLEAPVDEVGRFTVRPVPSGPVRLRIEHAGHLVHTTWVSYAG